ncbi:MAG: KH domain-containing protein [Leptospiraceae bacterium]|nr:KH domain-containing protein [Leptospiraceae bacterium]MDW8306576.1 KH domain-containing protein [Leptospiraceae bacterium]
MAKSDPVGLVEYVTKSLVKHPSEVKVNPVKGPTSLVIELRCHPEDLGIVIGKGGRIAKALRILLNAVGNKKVTLENGRVERYSKIVLEIIDE